MTDKRKAKPLAGKAAGKQHVAGATRTLALLNEQADGLRVELAQLRRNLLEVQRELTAERAAQLREANEKLVLAALHAQSIADAAVSNLDELVLSTQRDTLTDTEVPPPSVQSKEATLSEQRPEIDHLREANEQLVLAALTAQELEEQAELKHRRHVKFMAMVAHELRNPLNPIRTAAELLKRARGDETLLASLQSIIEKQVVHMAQLVDDLLEGSRGSTGRFRLAYSSVDLIQVLSLAVETCRPAIEARRQHLKLQLPPGPLNAQGDRVRLAQIFSNLLDNASKYTPEGGDIRLALVTEGETMVVTVSDNGIGIAPEELPHIFELFVQEERALGLRRGGLGIGLAVVRDLVEAHRGSVVVRSAGRGFGSEFVVRLPILQSHG